MPIPENIQTIISGYTSNLSVRYPPYNLFRLSTGWATSGEANSDISPNSYIYSNGSEFIVGNFAYSNIPLTTAFNGQDLWYHIFQEDETDLEYSVQINTSGEVVDISLGVVEFWVSLPFQDEGSACLSNKTEWIVYTNDPNYGIGSVLYTNQSLTTPLDRGGWYKIFDSAKVSLGFSILVSDNTGIIQNKFECK
jgi:hypothetical protein